ncbi:MAG: NAD-dependent protein deacylase [Spirochaetota bacterium]
MNKELTSLIRKAAELMVEAKYLSAFTGAGISVESGIPPFRGKNGLWTIYDPAHFEIDYFIQHPEESWKLLKKLFFETFEKAVPNEAHIILAELERKKILKALITQNIDNLHYLAGSKNIVEYHGNSRKLVCLSCRRSYPAEAKLLENLPPKCRCSGILKPDFVFFGEGIPIEAALEAERITESSDVMLVVGTTGQVYPAALIPQNAKRNGATIIEVNQEPSEYSYSITDIFIEGKATKMLEMIEMEIESITQN